MKWFILIVFGFSFVYVHAQEYDNYEFENGLIAKVATVHDNADQGLMKTLYLGLFGNGDDQSRFLGFDYLSPGKYNINVEAGDGIRLTYTHFFFSKLVDSKVCQSVKSSSTKAFKVKQITRYKIDIPIQKRISFGLTGGIDYARDWISDEKSLLNDFNINGGFVGLTYQTVKHAFIKVKSDRDKQGTTINNFFATVVYNSVSEKDGILPVEDSAIRKVVPRIGYQGRLGYWTAKGRGSIVAMLAYQPNVFVDDDFNWLIGLGIGWSWN